MLVELGSALDRTRFVRPMPKAPSRRKVPRRHARFSEVVPRHSTKPPTLSAIWFSCTASLRLARLWLAAALRTEAARGTRSGRALALAGGRLVDQSFQTTTLSDVYNFMLSFRYTFNYDAAKAANEGLQMRSDWLFPICTGAERLKDDKGDKLHPTQKPEALLARIMLATTKPGDVVLDPFFGSGTTGAVARKLGRHYIGLERDPDYIAIAKQRIAQVQPITDTELIDTPAKRSEPRIPFGWLIEHGLLEPGTVLHGPDKRWRAKVRADGTLITADFKGSIHQVGAHLQGAPSCNGWSFWHVVTDGKPVPIDVLRQKLRANLGKTLN